MFFRVLKFGEKIRRKTFFCRPSTRFCVFLLCLQEKKKNQKKGDSFFVLFLPSLFSFFFFVFFFFYKKKCLPFLAIPLSCGKLWESSTLRYSSIFTFPSLLFFLFFSFLSSLLFSSLLFSSLLFPFLSFSFLKSFPGRVRTTLLRFRNRIR